MQEKSIRRKTLRGTSKQGNYVGFALFAHLPYETGKRLMYISIVAFLIVGITLIFGGFKFGMWVGIAAVAYVVYNIIINSPLDGERNPGLAGYTQGDKIFGKAYPKADFEVDVSEVFNEVSME